MNIEIKVPQAGESVTEAMISEWFRKNGEFVEKDEPILELETDKSNLELAAMEAGVLNIGVDAGEVVRVGQVIGHIDPSAQPQETPQSDGVTEAKDDDQKADPVLSPAVRRIVAEQGLDPKDIQGSGKDGLILKSDALQAAQTGPEPVKRSLPSPPPEPTREQIKPKTHDVMRGTRTVPMSMLRRRIASRLLEAQQQAAILTTFNEVDMSAVMSLRKTHQEEFVKKHGLKLGFMSFFVKACVEALKAIPEINAQIVDQNIVYHDYQDIGVAVSSNRGLVVPVIRNAERLSFAGIEQSIMNYAQKARDGKIELADLSGGTFTISNGGIFGSLLSTPILNPPQSAILGMHKIEKRPIVIGDDIVIRPMMYLAMSYDHRIVDGKEAVTFLVKVKQALEDPTRLLLEI